MWKSTQRLLTVPPISNNKQTKDYFRATALVGEIPEKGDPAWKKNLWKLQHKTSRTSICGKTCASREELREHTEEHVTMFKAKTVSGWEEPSLFFCYSFRPYNSGFDLSSCTTRWVCYLTSLRRNTRPWWVSFFSEELSETDILVAYREECSLQSFWIYFNLWLPPVSTWGGEDYPFTEILNHLFWHLPHFRWIFNICLVAKSS